MYRKEIVDFFKEHNLYEEHMFNYLENCTDLVDYRDEDARMFIGFAYMCDKHDVLERFRICIPYAVDNKAILMSIHEIVHGIVGYKYLGKRFPKKIFLEALPFLYEKLYINESDDPSLYRYGEYLDSLIDGSVDERYRYALFARDYLLEEYDKDFNHMEKLSKKLVRKYKNENK